MDRVLVPVVLLLLAGCATGRGPTSDLASDPQAVEIVVRNNIMPPSLMTIRIISGAGTTRLLGSVPSGASRSFAFSQTLYERAYQMTAEPSIGNTILSQDFQLYEAARVVWSLNTNVLEFGYR